MSDPKNTAGALKATAARLTGAAGRPAGQPRMASARNLSTDPVRVTVELQRTEHQRLRRLCLNLADELGVAEVANAEVLRTLLDMATSDSTLAAQLRERIAETGGTRRRWSPADRRSS